MEVNLRKDAFFVEDEHWHKLQNNYEKFTNLYKDKKLVLWELGVGFNTPGIIRFPFEDMTRRFDNTTLIRVNDQFVDLSLLIQDKAILLKKDCKDVITQISASKSSLQRLMGIIISENLIECVKAAEQNGENSQELINEAVNLLVKSK